MSRHFFTSTKERAEIAQLSRPYGREPFGGVAISMMCSPLVFFGLSTALGTCPDKLTYR